MSPIKFRAAYEGGDCNIRTNTNHGLEWTQYLPDIDYSEINNKAQRRIEIVEQVHALKQEYAQVYLDILERINERYTEEQQKAAMDKDREVEDARIYGSKGEAEAEAERLWQKRSR